MDSFCALNSNIKADSIYCHSVKSYTDFNVNFRLLSLLFCL